MWILVSPPLSAGLEVAAMAEGRTSILSYINSVGGHIAEDKSEALRERAQRDHRGENRPTSRSSLNAPCPNRTLPKVEALSCCSTAPWPP